MDDKNTNPFDKLQYAKDAVKFELEHPDGSVDFHDIVYWAAEVKRLRREITESL